MSHTLAHVRRPFRGVMLPDGTSAVRVHGQVSAFVNRCPHQRVALNLPEGDFLEALPLSIDAEGNIHLASE